MRFAPAPIERCAQVLFDQLEKYCPRWGFSAHLAPLEGRQHGTLDCSTDATDTDFDEPALITDAVHREGGKIAMQILHFGRYAHHPDLVAPSAIQAPITAHVPRELTAEETENTIEDFVRAAQQAQFAGYDGVEIMGSEGYLINEFIVAATNHRTDQWGGD
ncbi:hypothetical protein A5761_10075 [Mycolicibacterium setense]|nr:hypothetical protein A5761_10075 [Mycolicibacterium setense]